MSSIGQGSISIDESTRIGQNAQDTANEVAGNVNDINSDNKLTPSEKLKLKQEYDKDVDLYNIDIEQLKSVDLPTAELETAMSNLTAFITPLFKEMDRTSTVDRDTLDSVFTAFATADKNASQAFANKVQQVADGAKKAGDDAKKAGEQAQEAGEAAKKAAGQAQVDATKAKADAATAQQKAQSSIDQLTEASTKFNGEIAEAKTFASQAQSAADNAFNQAKTVGSQASSAISVQSVATAKAQSAADNALSSASSAFAKAESTASEFGKVSQKANSAFDNALSAQSDASAAVVQATSAAADSKDAKQIAGAVSQSYKTLTDGSTMTIAELQNGLATKLTKTDLNGYATETWAQNKINATADGINGTMSSIKSTVDGQTTSINDLKADSSSFKSQFTTVNNTLGKQTTDIGSLQASSKELTSGFNTLTSDNTTNKNDISQLKQTATEVSSTLETVQTQVNNSAVGTNLIIQSDLKLGYLDDNGGVIPNADDFHSDNYIATNGETVFTFSSPDYVFKGSGNHSLAMYDSDKKYLGWQSITSATQTLNKSNVAYIRFSINFVNEGGTSGNLSDWLKNHRYKLEKGSLSTDWCPNPADIATQSQFTQLSGEIEQKVDSGDFSSYKTQTADLIGSKVSNGDFSTYKTQTADLIASKVATKDFSAYQATTAKSIESKVESSDFNTYKTQTDSAITSKVSTTDFNNLKISNRNLALGTATAFTMTGNDSTNNVGYMYHLSRTIAKGTTVTVSFDITSTSSTGIYTVQFVDSSWQKFADNLPLTDGTQHKSYTLATDADYSNRIQIRLDNSTSTVTVSNFIISESSKEVSWTPAPEDLATSTEFDQISNAIKLKVNSSDVTSQITESINNINLKVANANGSSSQVNVNDNTILLDANKIIFSGNTSILDGTIGTAKIANAAINTAQIADGAINNAKIANAAIDDAKINSLNGNKLVENSITANKINVNDLIANGINTKTLTAVNLNASTLTTPQIDLGLNGTFTEDFDYTQATTMFLPKKNKGTLTFNHGVLQSKGTMQTYTGGQWGGMNSNYNFQAGIDNSQWTEVAPGYIKLDLFRQDDANFVERTYIDPTGYYYKSGNGIASYLGNVLQTSQVQTPSLIGKYIGPSAGVKLLQIGNNGNDYGLQIGNYGGGEGVLSDFIYNATNSGSANIHITENGRLTRSTSASKYKYNIKNPDIETTLGDRLLNVRMATWNDKRAVDSYAEELSTGEEREKISIDKYYGLIAEQLRDAGLDMFINYGKNHEIEGIQYDRAWIPLLSVVRRLNDKVNEYELRLSKLEGTNK